MPVRDAVAGDLDALDALADAMVASDWRCDLSVARPTRAQLEAWIAGLHGRHVFVIDTLGKIEGGMVHQDALGKWWILERKLGFLLRLVQLCAAVWNAFGDCFGYVANPRSRGDVRTDGRFTIDDTTNLVRFHP